MAKLDRRQREEARVTEVVTRIAHEHGCTVTVDYETRTIMFEGPESAKMVLAAELEKYFDCF